MRKFLSGRLLVCSIVATFSLGSSVSSAQETLSESRLVKESSQSSSALMLPSPPKIVQVSSKRGILSANFTKPSNDGGSAIINYSYSVDGGSHWIVSMPMSVSSPLSIGRVGSGKHKILIRAITEIGNGAPSAPYFFTVGAARHPILPVRFKSLKHSHGLVVRKKPKKRTFWNANLRGEKYSDSATSDKNEVDSIDDTGKLVPAVISQTEPLNFDRIFIGPTGRTIAIMGNNSFNCSIAEISVSNGKSNCLATTSEVPLTNVELADQQISSMVPIKFDAVGNVYVSSIDSLVKVSVTGQLTYLVSLTDKVCVQVWRPLPHGGIVAFVNDSVNLSCGGSYHTVWISDATGIVVNTKLMDRESVSMYATPDDKVIVGDYSGTFRKIDPTSGAIQTLNIEYPKPGILRSFNQVVTLGDGRVIGIANNDWGRDMPLLDDPLGSPLIQFSPIVQAPDNILQVPNVPVPFLLVPSRASKVVVAGLANPDLCSDYSAVYNFEPQAVCPDTARLSIFDFETKTDSPIDLVHAKGGNQDPMDIYFLSASPDGKQVIFAGRRSKDHFKSSSDVIGICNLVTGVTKITPVAGLLGLSAY